MAKELKSLNRKELIEIIYRLKKSEQELQNENELLKKQLEDRRLKVSEAGTIADAALKISDVFNAAQRAADNYLAEIEQRRENVEKDYAIIIDRANKRAETIIREAEEERDRLLNTHTAGKAAAKQNETRKETD